MLSAHEKQSILVLLRQLNPDEVLSLAQTISNKQLVITSRNGMRVKGHPSIHIDTTLLYRRLENGGDPIFSVFNIENISDLVVNDSKIITLISSTRVEKLIFVIFSVATIR